MLILYNFLLLLMGLSIPNSSSQRLQVKNPCVINAYHETKYVNWSKRLSNNLNLGNRARFHPDHRLRRQELEQLKLKQQPLQKRIPIQNYWNMNRNILETNFNYTGDVSHRYDWSQVNNNKHKHTSYNVLRRQQQLPPMGIHHRFRYHPPSHGHFPQQQQQQYNQYQQHQNGHHCTDGFDKFSADITFISILFSLGSLATGLISLFFSNLFNVISIVIGIIELPGVVQSILILFGVDYEDTDPTLLLNTVIAIAGTLAGVFWVGPVALFSDVIAIISLIIGNISLGLGLLTTYPKPFEAFMEELEVKEWIEQNYGCGTETIGSYLEKVYS